MTRYVRIGWPRLALRVSRYMQCLTLRPDAACVVRDICASLHGTWNEAATGHQPGNPGRVH